MKIQDACVSLSFLALVAGYESIKNLYDSVTKGNHIVMRQKQQATQ